MPIIAEFCAWRRALSTINQIVIDRGRKTASIGYGIIKANNF
jgi:hypothetical protein